MELVETYDTYFLVTYNMASRDIHHGIMVSWLSFDLEHGCPVVHLAFCPEKVINAFW